MWPSSSQRPGRGGSLDPGSTKAGWCFSLIRKRSKGRLEVRQAWGVPRSMSGGLLAWGPQDEQGRRRVPLGESWLGSGGMGQAPGHTRC